MRLNLTFLQYCNDIKKTLIVCMYTIDKYFTPSDVLVNKFVGIRFFFKFRFPNYLSRSVLTFSYY